MGRTKKSIVNRVYNKGFNNTRREWTNLELDYIKYYYNNTPKELFELDELSSYIERNKTVICTKAKELELTNKNRPTSKSHWEKLNAGREKNFKENGHPRGMLGKHHTKETCIQMSKSRLGIKLNLTEQQRKERSERAKELIKKQIKNVNMYSRTKSGIREDLGLFMRSNWEANFARILNYNKQNWKYENTIFKLKTEKYGMKNYTVDFDIDDGYVEVKGWLDSRSKKTLKMFKESKPEEFKKLTMVIQKEDDKVHNWLKKLGVTKFIFYNYLRKEYKHKINWEGQ